MAVSTAGTRAESTAHFLATAAKYDSGADGGFTGEPDDNEADGSAATASEAPAAATATATATAAGFAAAFAAAATRRLPGAGDGGNGACADDIADSGVDADADGAPEVSGAARGDECADWDRDDGSDSEPPEDDDATIEAKDGGRLIAAGDAPREVGSDVVIVAVGIGCEGARGEAEPRVGGGCTATESGGGSGNTDDAVSAVVKCRTGQRGVSENR